MHLVGKKFQSASRTGISQACRDKETVRATISQNSAVLAEIVFLNSKSRRIVHPPCKSARWFEEPCCRVLSTTESDTISQNSAVLAEIVFLNSKSRRIVHPPCKSARWFEEPCCRVLSVTGSMFDRHGGPSCVCSCSLRSSAVC